MSGCFFLAQEVGEDDPYERIGVIYYGFIVMRLESVLQDTDTMGYRE